MARASVELIVEAAKAVNPLRRVQQQSKKVEQELKKTQRAARDVEAAFQRMGRRGIRSFRDLESNAARLGKRMGGIRGAIGKAAIGFVAFKAGQAAISRIESVRRLNRLGGAYGEIADLQGAATRAAETFGLSQTEANQQFSQIYARLRPVGVTLKDIESTFVGFNTVARLSGASSVEASNAFTQLAQALGSGALRGDEFNSISEQVPGILTAISQETGVAQGNLRKYAAEGKITSDVVMSALKRIEQEGADGLKDAMNGPAQAFKDFKNIADNALVALGEKSIPQVIRLVKQIGDAIEGLMPVIQAVGGFAAKVLGGVADIVDRIRDPSKLQAEAQAHFDKGMGKRPIANLPADLKETEAPFFALPKPPKDAQVIKNLEQKADISKTILALNKQLIAAEDGQQQRLAARLKLMIEQQNIAESNLPPREKELKLLQAQQQFRQENLAIDEEIAAQQLEAIAKYAKGFEAQMAHQDELRQAIAEQKSQYEELNTTFRNGIVDSILDAVEGTKSLGDSLLGVIKQMARLILQQQLLNALRGFNLFSFGGGGGFTSPDVLTSGLDFSGAFANGGRPAVGKAALVGERGPELFVPDRAGTIVPNGGFGGANVVVNVDASGSSVQGDEGSSRQLGALIGAAVQGEIIKQQRPGGLLSR